MKTRAAVLQAMHSRRPDLLPGVGSGKRAGNLEKLEVEGGRS